MSQLALQVQFHGDADGLPKTATGLILRQGEHFVAQSRFEEIRIFLDGAIEQAIYTKSQDDRTALTAIANAIKGGVNGFSLVDRRLIEIE